jgi:hypothetical protein
MALDLTELPVPVAEPVPAPAHHRAPEPAEPQRPRRHRRPRGRLDVPALADRGWRPLLWLAVVLFAVCGPVHAFGYTDAVYHLVLVGLALSAVAVPLGMLGLRHEPADDQGPV